MSHPISQQIALNVGDQRYTVTIAISPGDDLCAEIVISDRVPYPSWKSESQALLEAVTVWMDTHQPACQHYSVETRHTDGSAVRLERFIRQQIQVGDQVFGFRLDKRRVTTEHGSGEMGVFLLEPAIPPPDVLLEHAIYEALVAWYGAPLETLGNFTIDCGTRSFPIQSPWYGSAHTRMVLDGVNYYYRAFTSGNGEYQSFTVLIPLPERGGATEQAITALLRQQRLQTALDAEIHYFLRDGERWTVRI